MWWSPVLRGAISFVCVFIIGTLVEYVAHRFMHKRILLGKQHAHHHQDGWGQGWIGEFRDYVLPTLPFCFLGFFRTVPCGVGFVLGGITYAALAAYSHQLQHERPDLVFWMPRPVHYLHHEHHLWKTNFGILVDWWDRIFGTYQVIDWRREKPIRAYGWRAFFDIHWLPYHPPEDEILDASGSPASAASRPETRQRDYVEST